MLGEEPVIVADRPLTERAKALLDAGRRRFGNVECFGFVPSNYELVWSVLAGLERGRFVEWGSGFGIVTALAEILGYDASGVELEPELVGKSKALFAEFDLKANIVCGDYLESDLRADVYFVYCWPSQKRATEERFEAVGKPGDRLLFCEGQSDVRCKVIPAFLADA